MSRILVVDDESSIRLLYSHELADEGYELLRQPVRRKPLKNCARTNST